MAQRIIECTYEDKSNELNYFRKGDLIISFAFGGETMKFLVIGSTNNEIQLVNLRNPTKFSKYSNCSKAFSNPFKVYRVSEE